MNRRKFIKQTSIAAPFIVAFNPLQAAQQTFLKKLVMQGAHANRILVLIQLNGGNDSLNTIIPVCSYDILSKVRKNILIPENKILKLYNTNRFGFHPELTGLQKLYDEKMLSVVHGVSYPNPDRSHFKGINIKLTASCETDLSKSGWIGRYLEKEYPDYSNSSQFHATSGPPCMRIGEVALLISHSEHVDYSIGINSLADLNPRGGGISKDPVSNNMGGKTVEVIRDISRQSEMFSPIIKSAVDRQENLSELYPEEEKNLLADQLKIVARLIGGDLKTRVYVVNQNGYDTHANQVDRSDVLKGRHAVLLKELNEAITAFQDDLQLMGKQDDVLGMTFSEFGRKVKSVDAYGTDHGTAESVILFGTKLKYSMIGAEPEMDLKITDQTIPMQFDFRDLYASVLKGWFGVSEDNLKNIIKQEQVNRLDLFTV